DDGYSYGDEMGDLSEEDQLMLLSGAESVRKTLGPNTDISDQEIKESLWHYYFDEVATVAWLRKIHKLKPKSGEDASNDEYLLMNMSHRPGKHPPPKVTADKPCVGLASLAPKRGNDSPLPSSLQSLAKSGKGGLSSLSRKPHGQTIGLSALQGQPGSVVGKALAALKTKPPATSSSTGSHATPGLSVRQQGLSLSQLATVRSSTTPVLKNFSGRQIPAPKSISLSSTNDTERAFTTPDLSQQTRRRTGLDMGSSSSQQQPPVATL
ncbi:hypothetical protein EV175_006686, partial [Coemansia sp. RSA 1933]